MNTRKRLKTLEKRVALLTGIIGFLSALEKRRMMREIEAAEKAEPKAEPIKAEP